MATIIATAENPNFSSDLANPVTAVYDIYAASPETVFAVRRPLREGGKSVQVVGITSKAASGASAPAFTYKGVEYYICRDLMTWSDVDARDARRGVLVADADTAAAALVAPAAAEVAAAEVAAAEVANDHYASAAACSAEVLFIIGIKDAIVRATSPGSPAARQAADLLDAARECALAGNAASYTAIVEYRRQAQALFNKTPPVA